MRTGTARRSQSAAVMIEVALATVVFFMLVIAVMDLGRLHFFRSRLQYAVSQSARYATLGQAMLDKSGAKMTRADSIIQMIKNLSGISDFLSSDIVVNSVNKGGKTVSGPGGPGDVVTVQATYRVPILAPYLGIAFTNGRYQFTCATTFRNEEYRS